MAHSLRTAQTAEELADHHNIDREKAFLAGILHDYGKIIPCSKMASKAEVLGLEVSSVDRQYPYLLHARVGAVLARRDFSIEDEEVIKAIERHTLGWIEMSSLDKLIYLVDMIEPERYYSGVDNLRELVRSDLENAFKKGYARSLSYIIQKGKLIHPVTVKVWNTIIVKDGKDEGWL